MTVYQCHAALSHRQNLEWRRLAANPMENREDVLGRIVDAGLKAPGEWHAYPQGMPPDEGCVSVRLTVSEEQHKALTELGRRRGMSFMQPLRALFCACLDASAKERDLRGGGPSLDEQWRSYVLLSSLPKFGEQLRTLSEIAALTFGYADHARTRPHVALQHCAIVDGGAGKQGRLNNFQPEPETAGDDDARTPATADGPTHEEALSRLFARIALPGRRLERDDAPGEDAPHRSMFILKEGKRWEKVRGL